MKTNILYPLQNESTVNHTIVTNDPINLDNVTHLTFEDDYQSKKGFTKIIFHLSNGKKLEWVFGKQKEFDTQYSRIKELSIS